MRNINFRKAIISSVVGALVLVGTALVGAAQTQSKEYRDWQQSRTEATRRQNDYNRTHNRRDYDRWQKAEQRARERQMAYDRYASRYYNSNTASYNNHNNGQWRVFRNGSYYATDARGAALLRQAVNNGYAQGYRQGQMAKRRNWNYDYNRESIYRNGTYGYKSYVARDQYQYYFQQGFQRGYEDGYYNTSRYGYRTGNTFNLVGGILNTILNLTQN